jgi:hypothetical protein
VIDTRRRARVALGRDLSSKELFSGPHKRRTPPSLPALRTFAPSDPSEPVRVLTLGETAIRLGVSRHGLEAMIDAGNIDPLPTGYTRMIPMREVERLRRTN